MDLYYAYTLVCTLFSSMQCAMFFHSYLFEIDPEKRPNHNWSKQHHYFEVRFVKHHKQNKTIWTAVKMQYGVLYQEFLSSASSLYVNTSGAQLNKIYYSK